MGKKRKRKALRRLLKIIYYINNFSGVDTIFLAEKLGVSRRTIFRYMNDLKSLPDIKIDFINKKKGYEINFTNEADKKYSFNNRSMYIWTSKDMRILEFLTKIGVNDKKIAYLLNRSINAIKQKRSKINIRKEYNLKIDKFKKTKKEDKGSIYLEKGLKEKALKKYKKETGHKNFSQMVNDLLKSYIEDN